MNFIYKIGHGCLQAWLTLVSVILPTRIKRFIILTTIYKKGFDEQIFESLDFSSLNNRLHIANSLEAMENISMVAGKLWSDVELKTLLQESVMCNLNGECVSLKDATGIGEKLLPYTRWWLRYDKQTLAQDLASLFLSEKMYLSAKS